MNTEEKIAEIKASCPLCSGSGEVLQSKVRVMGYTLTDGESIDEQLVPCPLCGKLDELRDTLAGGELDIKQRVIKLLGCENCVALDDCLTDKPMNFCKDKRGYLKGAMQLLEEFAIHTRAQCEKEIGEILSTGDKILELASYADYSNGVEAFGMDEGRVRGYEMLKDLEEKWQALKKRGGE